MGFSGGHCNSDYNSFSGVKQLRLFFGSVLIWVANFSSLGLFGYCFHRRFCSKAVTSRTKKWVEQQLSKKPARCWPVSSRFISPFVMIKYLANLMIGPQHGNFVVCLNGGQVLPASAIAQNEAGEVIIQGHKDQYITPREEIKKVFKIKQGSTLSLSVLEEHSKLAAALISFEQAIAAYKEQVGEDPLVHRQGPVIFGAAAITLGIDLQRKSEDIDYVVSDAFLSWAETNWKHETDLAVDLADEDIFNLCGKWRERTCSLQGLLGTRFRLLHPMDVVMQKLLRRDPFKFEDKDFPDIQVIMTKLHPTRETIMGLLTENSLRYVNDPRDRWEPKQYDAVFSNTLLFLKEFLPDVSVEQVMDAAAERQHLRLAALNLVPLPSQSVQTVLEIEDLTDMGP